jgi:L-type amino acid transporter 9
VTHFLGKGVAYFATVLICLVIAGSALGNSFVAGRMTVAASNKNWIPQVLGTVGHIGTFKVAKSSIEDRHADEAMDQGESPINALVLNTVLSAIYILLGNMRILLTLNGLAEYAFFFLTVLGAIILRFKEPEMERPVKPFILIPILFAVISGFVVVRGAVFAPVQAGVLLAIWAAGLVLFYVRKTMVDRRIVV